VGALTTTPRVVVVGDLTIDDVVLPDGTTQMASLGGDSLYAALGARLWEPCVGIVTRRGEDFPRRQLDGLQSLGILLDGVVDIPGPTVRNWVIYEEDGRRHWVYRTAPGRHGEVAVQPDDLPAQWLSARPAPVVHVAAMPLDAAERIVEAVRRGAPDAVITLDTHEDYVRGYQERVLRLAREVTVFLPSREELADLVGYDDPPRALRHLSGEAGLRRVVVKAGKDGAMVWDPLRSTVIKVDAVSTRVVDVTGAGDAFCGGFAAGMANGQDLVQAARRGAVSAAFATEGFGSLALASVSPARATARLTGSPRAGLQDPFAIEWMLDEIRSAPDVVRNQGAAVAGPVAKLARSLAESGVNNIYMVGCGDSYLAGAAAALAFARHAGVAAEAVHALDMARYRVRYLPKNSAVLCVSSSGEVGRTIEAAAQARGFGHRVIALTANPASRLTTEATDVITLGFTPLGNTPGTISWLAMLVSLFELSLHWGETRGNVIAEPRAAIERAPDLIRQTITGSDEAAARLADRLRHRAAITFIGAGPNEATARFGAAKLFEGAQMRGVATNLEEWAHGEYFVTGEGQPVVVVAPSGVSSDRAVEILEELAFISADATLITDSPPATKVANVIGLAPGLPEEFSPLLAALPLSLLAFYLARDRGKRSYNFPSPLAQNEHYDTIHRDTRGRPA
jgi:fructoselysine-6-P-deglycase FrlB-like protein/sugar/nucleoside kinase (ribokinase family)